MPSVTGEARIARVKIDKLSKVASEIHRNPLDIRIVVWSR